MPNYNYIPAPDQSFAVWCINFAAVLSASPPSYGLTAPQAAQVQDAVNTYAAALDVATDPLTRTPVSIQAKDSARQVAEPIVRQWAMVVNSNPTVTDPQRTGLGLTVRKTTPSPIPAPTSVPVLGFAPSLPGLINIRYADSINPTGKAKPFGVVGVQIWRVAGIAPAVNPEQSSFQGQYTKAPLTVAVGADVGKVITFFARYIARSGPGGVASVGPWSTPLSVVGA